MLNISSVQRPLHYYFRLAFAITWVVGGLGLLLPAGPVSPFYKAATAFFIAGYGPTLAAFLVAARFGRGTAIRRLLAAAVPSYASVAWYPLALVGYPALALAVGRIFPLEPGSPSIPWEGVPILMAASLATDTGPLGEEFGWRGFALPRLLARRTPLASGLIVGLAWAAWHLPTFFISALPQSKLSIPLSIASTMALSVAMTGLYMAAGERLDVMILAHLVANFWASYVSAEARAVSHLLLATVSIPAARMWVRSSPVAAVESRDPCTRT